MKKITALEALRGFASIYVAIGHWVLDSKSLAGLPFVGLLKFGQEAVIIFFLLSGFVIYLADAKQPDQSLSRYFIRRFRRIYFPLICAFIVSIVLIPERQWTIPELIGNLLNLQDTYWEKPGNIVPIFMGNLPLWSLSYEWLFYMLFPFVYPKVKNSPNRVHIIGMFSVLNLIAYILFPNHLFLASSYFIIWWSGLELAVMFSGTSKPEYRKHLLFYYGVIIIVLLAYCAYNYQAKHFFMIGATPYLTLRHFFVALTLWCIGAYAKPVAKFFTGLIRPFAWLAPISYAIYILHYPILVQWNLQYPLYISIPVKLVLLFSLAWLIELKLQPQVNRVLK